MSVVRHRVIYGDTDAMEVVYYGAYMRFFEIGRNEFIRDRGLPYREIEAAGYVLPVIEVGAKYYEPARYDDEIEIHTEVAELKRASIRFRYRIVRASDQTLLAEGHTRHGCLNKASGRITRFPEHVLEAVRSD